MLISIESHIWARGSWRKAKLLPDFRSMYFASPAGMACCVLRLSAGRVAPSTVVDESAVPAVPAPTGVAVVPPVTRAVPLFMGKAIVEVVLSPDPAIELWLGLRKDPPDAVTTISVWSCRHLSITVEVLGG